MSANRRAEPQSLAIIGEEGPSTYNQFNSVTKRRIEKTTHRLAELHGNLFCGERQDSSQWDNGKEVDGEDGGGAPAKYASGDANGHSRE